MKLNSGSLRERLLGEPPRKLSGLYEECRKMAGDQRLEIGGKPIPFIPVPHVMDRGVMEGVAKRLDVFVQALLTLERQALSSRDGILYRRLMSSLTPGGRALVEQCSFESGYSLLRRHRRIDGYLRADGGYSVIEVNQAAPLAIHYHDTAQRIAARLLEALGFEWQPELLSPRILEWFLGEYGQRNPGGFPRVIALVIEHGYPPKFTDLPMMSRALERLAMEKYGQEMSILTCFPYEVKLRGGKMVLGQKEIDMIWRNSVYMAGYREEGKDLADYDAICTHPDEFLLINSTRSWLTRTKEVSALFWDEECCRAMGLSPGEAARVREVVPYSVNLKYAPDARKDVMREKDSWITKPSDSGFGKGVEFGALHTEDSWKCLVDERSRNEGFVFQKRVAYPRVQVLDIDPAGSLVEYQAEFDFCPHHVNGDFTGTALSRANRLRDGGEVSKMNLVAGGLMHPLIFT
jgi:hypothetical protein